MRKASKDECVDKEFNRGNKQELTVRWGQINNRDANNPTESSFNSQDSSIPNTLEHQQTIGEQKEGAEPSSCSGNHHAGYDHMLRRLEHRAYRRNQFHQATVDKLTHLRTAFLFLIASGLLFNGWMSHLATWLYRVALYWTSGWGVTFASPSKEVASRSLLLAFAILSSIGFLFTLYITKSRTFIALNLIISKTAIIGSLIALLFEVFLIYPFCWIASSQSSWNTFCATQHDCLWKSAAFTFAWLQSFLGMFFWAYSVVASNFPAVFYTSFPLCCVFGSHFQVHHSQKIQSMADLADVIRFSHPTIIDSRIIRIIEETLEIPSLPVIDQTTHYPLEEEDPSTRHSSQQQGIESKPEFGFISFGLRPRCRLFRHCCYSLPCDLCSARPFDALYVGHVDQNHCPEGIGIWIDLRPHGETVYGYWENGKNNFTHIRQIDS